MSTWLCSLPNTTCSLPHLYVHVHVHVHKAIAMFQNTRMQVLSTLNTCTRTYCIAYVHDLLFLERVWPSQLSCLDNSELPSMWVSWVRILPEAANFSLKSDCSGLFVVSCVVLPCLSFSASHGVICHAYMYIYICNSNWLWLSNMRVEGRGYSKLAMLIIAPGIQLAINCEGEGVRVATWHMGHTGERRDESCKQKKMQTY